jgi:hypothetical protein
MARAILNMPFMVFAPEQSYQLDYATCDYIEGVTGFSAKLLLSVRSWREKLRRCFIRISRLFVARAMESEVRPTLVTYACAALRMFNS